MVYLYPYYFERGKRKQLKKTLALLLASASVLTLALTACGGNGTSSGNAASGGVVNVYNWGEYIDMSVLDDFTA